MNCQERYEQLERMQEKLESYSRADGVEVICVNCGEGYIQAHSGAGQPHRFCNRKCEVSFWKIEAYKD